MPIRRTLAAVLAATAIAAPAGATAKPVDMHASTALAAAQAQHRQDLRSPDAADAARHPRKSPVAVDARGATAVDSQSTTEPVAPGQPTWAVNPKPIAPAPAPAVAKSDDGVDWLTIGLGIAGTLLVLGGIVAVTNRSRRLPRARLSA
jgi:hypothetical protein